MNQAVMRAQRFFESEIGNSTLPDTYYKANGGEPDTRSADSRFMLSGAIEPDWSMAQTWEYEQDIVTEVPALLTLPIRYTTLIEERGDTVSLTTQAPHSRLRIIENPETGVMYSFVITLLPDESYGGDPSLLGSHPIESDYWGISVYSKPDGTPLLGYRYENGEFKGSLMFDDNYDDQAISDLLIVIGYDSGPSTRQSVQMELEMMTYRIISVDGRHYLVEENDSYMIGGGGSPVVVQERINRPPDGYYQGNPIWDIPGGNGNPDIQVPGGGGGGSGSGGNGGTTPIDLGITVSVPNGFCVLGSIAAAIQVKFGDNASTAIDKAEAAMNAAGVTVDDINITMRYKPAA